MDRPKQSMGFEIGMHYIVIARMIILLQTAVHRFDHRVDRSDSVR